MAVTDILSGLRMPRPQALTLFQETLNVRDSSTYLGLIEEGRVYGLCETVCLVGEARLGPPPPDVVEALDAILDLERLRRMIRKAMSANSWQEVIDTP